MLNFPAFHKIENYIHLKAKDFTTHTYVRKKNPKTTWQYL